MWIIFTVAQIIGESEAFFVPQISRLIMLWFMFNLMPRAALPQVFIRQGLITPPLCHGFNTLLQSGVYRSSCPVTALPQFLSSCTFITVCSPVIRLSFPPITLIFYVKTLKHTTTVSLIYHSPSPTTSLSQLLFNAQLYQKTVYVRPLSKFLSS